jgi:hypothetical protein
VTPLTASLIVGAVWGLRHMPLFFIEGANQRALGVGMSDFFLFTGQLFPQSILLAWLYHPTISSAVALC